MILTIKLYLKPIIRIQDYLLFIILIFIPKIQNPEFK